MVLDGVFMQVDVNDNFFENNFISTISYFLKQSGGNISFSKYPAMCNHGLNALGGEC